MSNPHCQRLIKAFLVILIFSISSCSSGDDDDMEPEIEPERDIDLAEISGKYRGTWSWDYGIGLVVGPILMEIAASTNNEHAVNFYETAQFVPNFNSDRVTPEARGTIIISDSGQVTIELTLNTDAPPCVGDYTGSVTHNDLGRLVLGMDIVHDCAVDGIAVLSLLKIADL
ncbi:MAG: hypothetical protein RIF33_20455 [Cyclobacteriaceae bacterium]